MRGMMDDIRPYQDYIDCNDVNKDTKRVIFDIIHIIDDRLTSLEDGRVSE